MREFTYSNYSLWTRLSYSIYGEILIHIWWKRFIPFVEKFMQYMIEKFYSMGGKRLFNMWKFYSLCGEVFIQYHMLWNGEVLFYIWGSFILCGEVLFDIEKFYSIYGGVFCHMWISFIPYILDIYTYLGTTGPTHTHHTALPPEQTNDRHIT